MKIVLEGMPGVGKTTLLTALDKNLGAYLVPEIALGTYTEDTVHNQGIDTEEQYLRNDEYKCQIADQESKNGHVVVTDRNYVSTLAYNFAVTEYGTVDSYNHILSWYLAKTGKMLTPPDLYVYLDMTVDDALRRKGREPDKTKMWHNPEFLKLMEFYYHNVFPLIDVTIPHLKIDGNKSTIQIVEEIKTWIK